MDNSMKECIFYAIRRTIVNVILGLVILIFALLILWWNEGNSLRVKKLDNFIRNNVVSINPAKVDPVNNNKLVYIVGNVISHEILSDGIVSVNNAVGLFRYSQMYQWEERSQRHSNYYNKKWRSELIDSSQFAEPVGHENPLAFLIGPKTLYAPKITLGAYTLNPDLIKEIQAVKNVTNLHKTSLYKLMPGDYYYSGTDPANPHIGDYKIAYAYIPSGTQISVIGQQNKNSITPYITPQGKFFNVTMGISSPDEIIKKLTYKNKFFTNLFRIVSILFIWVSLSMLTSPLNSSMIYFSKQDLDGQELYEQEQEENESQKAENELGQEKNNKFPLSFYMPEQVKIRESERNKFYIVKFFSLGIISFLLGTIVILFLSFEDEPLKSVPIIILAGVGIYMLIKQLTNKYYQLLNIHQQRGLG